MKNAVKAFLAIQIFLYTAVPVCSLIAILTGYEFSMRSYIAYAAVLTAVAVAAAILAIKNKDTDIGAVNRAFAALVLPASLLNGLCYIVLSERKIVILCMAVCSLCAVVYTRKYVKSDIVKLLSSAASAIIAVLLSLVSVLCFIIGGFFLNRVVESKPSPGGLYVAQVIESDQGALGGDTFVRVYDVKDFYFFKFSRMIKEVYSGDWMDYENIAVYWQDDNTVVVNGSACKIE